jgi:large exoprotein involved in heme utilization and adhesion
LFIDANRILLTNQGNIRADTTGGGGNINLRSPFILLRNGSNITTNATGANIPGGNIAIDTRFLIAVANEDSNISANSEDFRGGNVSIKAFSIYGIQPRPNATPLSDITATGATATLGGTIDVTTAGIDPIAALVALPTDLVDSSGLIAQGCPANQGNSFVISGRGGLPPTPEQQLDDDAEWSDRSRLVVAQQANAEANGRAEIRSQEPGVKITSEHRTQNSELTAFPPTCIIEATGWRLTSTGEMFLVGTTVEPTGQNPLNQPLTCQGR